VCVCVCVRAVCLTVTAYDTYSIVTTELATATERQVSL